MAKAPKRLCACGKVVQGKCPRCTKGKHRQYDSQRESSYRRGYGGKTWEATRKAVFLRDEYKCQGCGRLVGMRKRDAHCDHIIAKEAGGTDTMDNLQTLCHECHSRKTVLEDGGLGR